MIIDELTQQRIPHMKFIGGDMEYDLSGDPAVVQEDVPLIGEWTDWTGTGGVQTREHIMFASQENTLQGEDAQVKWGAKVPNLTDRGNRAGTHRQRTIKKHVEIPCKK